MRTIWVYLRVSTKKQNNEKNEQPVDFYIKANKLKGTIRIIKEVVNGRTAWQDRELARIINSCKSGDIVITPEISRFSRDFFMTMDILNEFLKKNVDVHFLKPEITIVNKEMTSKDKLFTSYLALEAEVDSLLKGKSSQEGQAASIKHIGRPKLDLSNLDKNSSEIMLYFDRGWTISTLAKDFGVSKNAMKTWIKKNK